MRGSAATLAVNDAFAGAVLAQARSDREPRVMLHDYHLYTAALRIRRARPRAVLSHFTHIPWPPSSIWQNITPAIRAGIATGLLANDVVGFQTERYAHNFLRMVESFVPDAQGRLRRADGTARTPDDPRAALPDQHRRRRHACHLRARGPRSAAPTSCAAPPARR